MGQGYPSNPKKPPSGFANVRGGLAFAASNGTITTGTLILTNSNSVTFGMLVPGPPGGVHTVTASVSGAGAVVGAISAGTVSGSGQAVLSNSNGLTFGVSGSSRITAQPVQLSFWTNTRLGVAVPSISTPVRYLLVQRVSIGAVIAATRLGVSYYYNGTSNNTLSAHILVYTLTGSTASLASSVSFTHSSALGAGGSVTYGPLSTTLNTWAFTPGEYLIGSWGSTSNTGGSQAVGLLGAGAMQECLVPGAGTGQTAYFLTGMITATTAAPPTSVHLSQLPAGFSQQAITIGANFQIPYVELRA